MTLTRLYASADGHSHFEDLDMPLRDAGDIGRLSAPVAVEGLIFRENDGDYDYDWHCAPARQYIVLLDGEIEIEASDGEVRRFRGGEVLLVEDVTGRGHRTRSVDGRPRRSLFITLPGGRPEDRPEDQSIDVVEEADRESFPASDPPAWTGTTIS